jgi:aldehyde dehydrogenase (NAD+)
LSDECGRGGQIRGKNGVYAGLKRAELLLSSVKFSARKGTVYPGHDARARSSKAGGDVQEAIDCTYYTAGEGRRLHGFTTPAEMPNKLRCVRQPVGMAD